MMSMRITTGKLCTLAVVAAALTVGSAGLAQQPPGGGGAGGGGGRGGQRGGRGGFGQQLTLASVPAPVLADGLKLSASQVTKIQAIQDQYRKDRTALRPAQGEQVDRNELFQKMGALDEETTKSIQGVLNESQNKQAPAFLKAIGGYRMVGIPLEVLPDLKLTSDQKTKITSIAEGAQKQMADARAAAQAANGGNGGAPGAGGPGAGGAGGGFQQFQEMMKANSDKAAAVLTTTQKATLAKYVADHPQRGFGGRGGGRRGGGAGAGGNGPV
jgi:hypothetical protein